MIWINFNKRNLVGSPLSLRRCVSQILKALGVGIIIYINLGAVSQASQSMGLPTNVCLDRFCGPAQKEMWNRFNGATGLKTALIPSVYSGICYHNNPAYNPHDPQFGGVLIDKAQGRLLFRGRFSFHKQKPPYTGLKVDTARKRFPESYEVSLYDRFAYAESSLSLAPFRYWFRQESETNDLLLVGFFGFKHTILCAFERH